MSEVVVVVVIPVLCGLIWYGVAKHHPPSKRTGLIVGAIGLVLLAGVIAYALSDLPRN